MSPLEMILLMMIYVVIVVPSIIGYLDNKIIREKVKEFRTRYTDVFDELHSATKDLSPEDLRDILTNKKP